MLSYHAIPIQVNQILSIHYDGGIFPKTTIHLIDSNHRHLKIVIQTPKSCSQSFSKINPGSLLTLFTKDDLESHFNNPNPSLSVDKIYSFRPYRIDLHQTPHSITILESLKKTYSFLIFFFILSTLYSFKIFTTSSTWHDSVLMGAYLILFQTSFFELIRHQRISRIH